MSLISVQASQGNSCYTCCTLQMLGLYLFTLIKGHKYCNMLSILNELTLVKELQNFVTMFFWKKSKITTTTKHKNPCQSRELKPGALALKVDTCVTSAPPSQLRISILIKLFNCFDAMDRNVKKQS